VRVVSRAGVVVFVSSGLPALRAALRGIRETVPDDTELAVVAADAAEQDATYLLRQYLRGRLAAVTFDRGERHATHCGLDLSEHLVRGGYLARVDDTLAFRPGWLDLAVAALEDDESLGCLSLVPPSDFHRGRGRPRTVHIEPVEVDHLDMRCFVTRRDLVERHGRERIGEQAGGCRFQEVLRASGRRLAFLPGLAGALDVPEVPRGADAGSLEAELPAHAGGTGSMERLEQAYDLGDDVLLTCMSCGAPELEVLAARVRFCERHQVALGFWYELRCPACGELHYKDDYQFRCPA
jgi:hypothetical protein